MAYPHLKLRTLLHSLASCLIITGVSASVFANDLELKAHGSSKRQYKLIFDSEEHTQSRNWLSKNFSSKDALTLSLNASQPLPPSYTLANLPPVYDQGNLGSCTANALAAAMQYNRRKQKLEDYTPSRLMIYYLERSYERTINQDSGASLADGIRALSQYGACPESMWPYNDGPTQFKRNPTSACYTAAKQNMDLDNLALAGITQTLNNIKSTIAQGIPIVFGTKVYDSFESDTVARTGNVPIPNTRKERLLGGHALMIAGYDDSKSQFFVRNSWGTDWGVKGYAWFPYDYITNKSLCSDFWKIEKVGSRTSQSQIIPRSGNRLGNPLYTAGMYNPYYTDMTVNLWGTPLFNSILKYY